MFDKIKKIFKKKPKDKRVYDKLKDHGTDISYENEIKKPEVKEIKSTVSETKAETKSSLTFGE